MNCAALRLPPSRSPSFSGRGNGERGGVTCPPCHGSLSLSVFLLWRHNVLPEGWGMDGHQPSSVKSSLCLMNRGALPSRWAEFTSSHNHLSLFQTFMHLISFCPCPSDPPCFFWDAVLFLPMCLSPSHLQSLFVPSSLFISYARNPSMFAASGTRRTTQNPGTTSTQPTSTR